MEPLQQWLVENGWSEGTARFAAIAVAVLVAALLGRLLRALAHAPIDRLFKGARTWHEATKRFHLASRIARVVTTIIAIELVLPLLEPWPQLTGYAEKLLDATLVITLALAVSGFVSAVVYYFDQRNADEKLPVRVIGQALQMTLWAYAAVALLAALTGKDVSAVVTGLTAVGAVLVYVFRDPILGWTAGVQLAANNLVREGDWITVPKHGADGNVEEISLTTVKVRNWDKTVASIPTYTLFSEGFRNWRGMYESGGRRIKRSIPIDATSVRFCDEELADRWKDNPLMEKVDLSTCSQQAESNPLSDQRPTNLSCFRAWLEAWLEQHPKIHDDMLSMVRELEPDGRGVPVEIYVFSNDQNWERYEKLQAEILDHVLAILPQFDLRVFQEPTGEDLRERSAADREAR